MARQVAAATVRRCGVSRSLRLATVVPCGAEASLQIKNVQSAGIRVWQWLDFAGN
jgi:hypothetical protein